MNRAWFLTCISLFAWQVGLYGTVVANSAESALFWQRILYIGTILIPIFLFYFCLNLLHRENNKKSLFVGFFLSAFFILLSFSKFFIVGVGERVDFGYWPVQTGSLYFIFLIYFAFYAVYSVVLLKIDSKKHEGVYQKQIQFVYYAALIGLVGGSTNFLLDFGVNTYSIGNWFVILYIVFISYALFKHHLFNIKVIATELFTFALWIILFIRIFFSVSSQDLLLNVGIFLSVLLFGALLIRGVLNEVRQREKIEKIGKELEKAYAVEKRANEELKELDNVKNQFLMTIQHHLRTPLTSMRGYADLLLSGTFGKVPPKIKEVIEKFEASTTSLIKMVNDFLDITQFQLGKSVVALKDGVDLSPILEEVVKDIELEAKNKGIYLKLEKPEGPCVIKADESKIKAAIVNIFDNSVKYTKEGGVTMRLKVNDGKVRIEVQDTGMGISKETMSKLFGNTFERTAEAKKTFTAGRGIGLYLSSQIIKAHNGKVWAESEGEGKGSMFIIELPIGV